MGTGPLLFDHWFILLMKSKSKIVTNSLQTEYQLCLLNEERLKVLVLVVICSTFLELLTVQLPVICTNQVFL